MVRGMRLAVLFVSILLASGNVSWSYFLIEVDSDQFTVNNVFSDVDDFRFLIGVDEPLATGVFDNPTLDFVVLNVSGELASGTPSGFPSFGLNRNIGGAEFYNQGSSLRFEIAAGANLADGVSMDELIGLDPTLLINAREVGTGRYHPPLLELNSNGTGRIQNSNNMGGVNPATGMVVNVDFGDEYITDLAFNPSDTLLIPGNQESFGDFNGDGAWDCADADLLVEAIVTGSSDPMFDISLNGAVTPFDMLGGNVGWLTVAGRNNPALTGGNPFLVGDGNLDGVVDGLDFIAWNENRFTLGGGWCGGDYTVDGIVDGNDFIAWNDNRFSSSSDLSAVPEPAGALSLLIGLLMLARRRR